MIGNSDWLAQAATAYPHKIALCFQGQEWSYATLHTCVAELAGQLVASGMGPGTHVAVLMPNRPEYVYAIHALMRIGAVIIPLNLRLTAVELDRQLEQVDSRFLLCSPETISQAQSLWRSDRRVFVVKQSCLQGLDMADRVSHAPPVYRGRPRDPEMVQGILFTSGTTGQPKGAMLTYKNHLSSAIASAFRLGTLPADRWLVCMPLYHVGGLAIILRCCLYGTTVVLQEGFDVDTVNQVLDTQQITLVSLVPTMLYRLLEARGERPFPPHLRCVLLGGAPAPARLLHQAILLGIPVATTYGLTEAASQVATASPTATRHKPGSVGKPLMFSSVRIVGEEGREQGPGEIGEIVVSGPTVMQGYYKQEQATAAVLRDGELYTGDLGYRDEEGDLWVVQRRADLIITGGENVYPAEVEQIMLSHPAVKAVCVVGVEDEEWGQRVAAAVVVQEDTPVTETELLRFCATRLAGYKLPRLLRLVDSLPQTPSGKVRREAVKALFSA